jgi:NAD kinase
MPTIGLVANPASGKDIRRLVARASVFDNQEKQAIVRRVIAGIQSAAGKSSWRLRYLNDAHGLVQGALKDIFRTEPGCDNASPIAETVTNNSLDTTAAARALADLPADIVITLGGDGTNRAFALGWNDAPLIPISTGTNNVFPFLIEATVAGAAAGVIATGAVKMEEVSMSQKIIHVEIENEAPDLALIDAVLVAERFVGSRALLDADSLRSALLTVADPAAVGVTAIGGLIEPLSPEADSGMHLEFGKSENSGVEVLAPIAPGYYQRVRVLQHRSVAFSQTLSCQGPGVLAFDGERERVLKPGQSAKLTITRSGPKIVDVAATMKLAAERGCFLGPPV